MSVCYYSIIRHGDPIYRPDDLTDLGKRQAEALAKRLALYGLDRICSSTSNRARLTAEPIAQLLKKEVVELDWCKEAYAYRELTIQRECSKPKWIFQDDEFRSVLVSDEVTALGHQWWKHTALSDPRFRSGYERIQKETRAFLAEHG